MKILYGIEKLPSLYRPLVTIGIFDGFHLGHQKLLRKLVEAARRKRKKAVVITFAPHPRRVLHPDETPPMILSLLHRLKLLEGLGIDLTIVLRFNKRLASLSAEDFVREILVRKLDLSELFVGDNFRLGYARGGNTPSLRGLSSRCGFKLNIVKCRRIGNKVISSTSIRNLVMEGRLKEASFMLGRRVSILGTVVSGDKRGRILGFPTSNLDLHHEAVPPAGVYAVLARFEDRLHKGVLNIGFRPTFKKIKKEKTIELHIFDFKRNIYGKDLEVIFIKKIRDERHFKNKGHLREQIKRDCKLAKKVLEIYD